MEISVKVHHSWLKEEQALMTRLHHILSDSNDGPFSKDNGYKWQLDASNDWWAEIREDKLIIATRYSKEKLDALGNFVQLFLA